MPAHGFLSARHIENTFGWISDYVAPSETHPDSTLYRLHYNPTSPNADPVGRRREQWMRPGCHYHANLPPGGNTINLHLVRQLYTSIVDQQGYDAKDYMERYIRFMLEPGLNPDTYIPDAHREFFLSYGMGKPPERCGQESTHVDGLVLVIPLILLYCGNLQTCRKHVRAHLYLTHRSESLARAADLFTELMLYLLRGWDMETALYEKIGRDRYSVLAHPFRRWRDSKTDLDVAQHEMGVGPLASDAMPLIIHLALKYADDPEAGLQANANLGGDSCHRGALLGALLGAANGCEQIPGDWVSHLVLGEELNDLGERLWELVQEQASRESGE